jgi:hypothetical protein
LLGYIDVASNRGLDGMEKMLDTLLQGRPGVARMIRDPRGQEIAIPRGILRPAEPGRDVILTIDHEWQAIAEGVLRRTVTTHSADGGDVVILDVRSGELLAVASLRTPEGGDAAEPTASVRAGIDGQDLHRGGDAPGRQRHHPGLRRGWRMADGSRARSAQNHP